MTFCIHAKTIHLFVLQNGKFDNFFPCIEVSQEEMLIDDSALAEETDEVEELVEIQGGKRKPKYIPGVSKPLFHSTIRGSSNERK